MNKWDFSQFIAACSPVVLDGAMGTLRRARGSKFNPVEAHKDYLEAGASIITADTVALTAEAAAGKELQTILAECRLRVGDAVEAVKQYYAAGGEGRKYVAGSIWPIDERMEVAQSERRAIYYELVHAMVEAGADLIIVETAASASEAAMALEAIERAAPQIATIASFVLPEREELQKEIAECAAVVRECEVSAAGFNCVRPTLQMFTHLDELARGSMLPIVFYPSIDGTTTPDEFVGTLQPLLQSGRQMIVGGCCGTTPEHIKALSHCAMAFRK